MSQGANVGSIEAVRDFRAALATFVHDAREAVLTFELESRRALEWLTDGAPRYWQEQARRADDAVTEARIELERCRVSKLPGGEPRSCLEERKAYERAKRRREYVDEKQRLTRKWAIEAEREAREYAGRATQLESAFDGHFAEALDSLDKSLLSLESYVVAGSSWTRRKRPAAPSNEEQATSMSRPTEEPDPSGEVQAQAEDTATDTPLEPPAEEPNA